MIILYIAKESIFDVVVYKILVKKKYQYIILKISFKLMEKRGL